MITLIYTVSLRENRLYLYYSVPYVDHEPLTSEEELEFQKWTDLFQKTHSEIGNKHYFQFLTKKLHLEASSLRNNPKEILLKLKKYMQEQVISNPDLHVIDDSTLGYFPLSNIRSLSKLRLVRFGGSFEPTFRFFTRGSYTKLI